MKLEGSCHCGAVRFTLLSRHPYPFARCYCSICRKTAGGGGYAINLGGEYATLEIEGRKHICVYQAMPEDAISTSMFIPRSRLQPGISGSGSSKVSSTGGMIGMVVLGDRRIATRNGPLYVDNAKLFRSGAGGI